MSGRDTRRGDREPRGRGRDESSWGGWQEGSAASSYDDEAWENWDGNWQEPASQHHKTRSDRGKRDGGDYNGKAAWDDAGDDGDEGEDFDVKVIRSKPEGSAGEGRTAHQREERSDPQREPSRRVREEGSTSQHSGPTADSETDAARTVHLVFNPTTRNKPTKIEELKQQRKAKEEEIEELERGLGAMLKKARRRNLESGPFVWVLIEYDNYGCERYLDGYALIPPNWGVYLFRNKQTTGFMPPVMGVGPILSMQSGRGKKNDDKNSVTYPTADINFSVGDIAVLAEQKGIADLTTVYFVCSPVIIDNPRFQQEMLLLRQFGIESHCYDGVGSMDDIMQREGEDISTYKTSNRHRPPSKTSRSRGPPTKRTASLGRL